MKAVRFFAVAVDDSSLGLVVTALDAKAFEESHGLSDAFNIEAVREGCTSPAAAAGDSLLGLLLAVLSSWTASGSSSSSNVRQ